MPLDGAAAAVSPLEQPDGNQQFVLVGRLLGLSPHLIDPAIQLLNLNRFALLDGPRPPVLLQVAAPCRVDLGMVLDARRDACRVAAGSDSDRI